MNHGDAMITGIVLFTLAAVIKNSIDLAKIKSKLCPHK